MLNYNENYLIESIKFKIHMIKSWYNGDLTLYYGMNRGKKDASYSIIVDSKSVRIKGYVTELIDFVSLNKDMILKYTPINSIIVDGVIIYKGN